MKATLDQVASLANVSKATASRVLNNNPSVSGELRDKVLAAARALNYQLPPERRGRKPSMKDVGLLLVLVTDSLASDWYFVSMLQGIEETLREHERNLTLITASQADLDSQQFLESIAQRSMDGLIVGGGLIGSDTIKYLSHAHFPLVVFDRYLDRQVSGVVVDHFGSLLDVIQHLASLGHKRIGMVNGPAGVPACDDKYHGYRAALEQSGMDYNPALVARDPRYHTTQGGYDAAISILQQADRPTAIFASDDLMAYGVIQAAEKLGLRVPEDLAVVGYGDVLYSQVGVPLTSLKIDFTHYGRLVARMLLDLADEKVPAPLQIALRASLVVRNTCGANSAHQEKRLQSGGY